MGQFKPTRHHQDFKEIWTDGSAFDENQQAYEKVTAERNEILAASQNLRKRKPTNNPKEIKRFHCCQNLKEFFCCVAIVIITQLLNIITTVKEFQEVEFFLFFRKHAVVHCS